MKKAFTIVELLLFMGLVSGLLLILTQILQQALELQLESVAFSSVHQDEAYLLTRLGYDIRRASSIVTPAGPGQTSSSLQLSISGQPYTYSLSNGRLVLTAPASSEPLSSLLVTASNFTVQRLGAGASDSLKISLSLTDQSQTRQLSTTISLRP